MDHPVRSHASSLEQEADLSMLYLAESFWPVLAIAVLIGAIVGWLTSAK
ncbi:cell division protein FtsX [Ochrobactrum daejeonense]|uniref:Cell division protein FtsX n=1 Tax=Brucella daejeonensis TaxID=659015 RepID=A0A7W9AVP7_9HYPH|nr:hypothetical protein [Brucella daejeonensis]MBB5701316.1 cell division protein FtsX [Brucella daejeonensis]